MHRPLVDYPQLAELLQHLGSIETDRTAYRRQIQAIILAVQQSPELWRPAILPDAAYSDGLADLYISISENPMAIPLVGSMDWLNAQLQAAFATHLGSASTDPEPPSAN